MVRRAPAQEEGRAAAPAAEEERREAAEERRGPRGIGAAAAGTRSAVASAGGIAVAGDLHVHGGPQAPARELRARGHASAAPAEAGGEGGFPPRASSTGRRFYAFTAAEVPWVAAGQEVALRALGGSWTGGGRAPRGFGSLEEAIQVIAEERRVGRCEVVWR